MSIAIRATSAGRVYRTLLPALIACSTLFVFASSAHAAKSWFYLAQQGSANSNRGFSLDLESSVDAATCPLSSLGLTLGIGDGTAWRNVGASAAWQYNHVYHLRAVIGPKVASLYLDGALLRTSPGGFSPERGDLTGALIPKWGHDPAQYQVRQESLTVSSNGVKPAHLTWAPPTRARIAISTIQQVDDKTITGWRAGGSVTIDATFKIVPMPDWHEFAPLIDRYGQSVYSQWPGKITSDDQIMAGLAKEDRQFAAWGVPKDYDQYGGYLNAGWNSRASGFYRVEKHNGMWWLITPLGNPCFYTGLCSVSSITGDWTPVVHREQLFADLPPKTGPYAAIWGGSWGARGSTDFVDLAGATSVRIHGAGWQKWEGARAKERLREWGFSGVGKWGLLSNTPVVWVLRHDDVPSLVDHPDIFDPKIQAQYRASLTSQMAKVNSPYVVGWSVWNEFPEDFTPDEITGILGKDGTVPSKQALVDYALKNLYGGDIGKMAAAWQVTASTPSDLYKATPKPSASDIEKLRNFYARSYFAWVYKTVKSIDPNHLYFGYWIVPRDWWVNESDWFTIAPYCDVIGYDHYTANFAYPGFTSLLKRTNKPVICGEYGFPPDYNGDLGYGRYDDSVQTDAQAGDHYYNWMKDAAQNPYCVGACFFEYRDDSLTGWGPALGSGTVYGEDYPFGLVTMTGLPKWDIVDKVRAANLSASQWRMGVK